MFLHAELGLELCNLNFGLCQFSFDLSLVFLHRFACLFIALADTLGPAQYFGKR